MRVDLIILILSRALVSLSYLISTRVCFSVLPLSEIGAQNYFLSIIQLCTMFGVYPAGTFYQNIFVGSVKTGNIKRESVKFVLVLFSLGLLVSTIVSFGKYAGLFSLKWSYLHLFLLTMLFLVGLPMKETFLNCLNLILLRKEFIIANLLSSYITIILGLMAVNCSPTSFSWLVSTGLTHLVFGVGIIFYTVIKHKSVEQRPQGREFKFSNFFKSLVFVSMGMWVVTDLGKFVLEKLGGIKGDEALGVFTVLMTTGGVIVTIFDRMFADIFSPKIFNSSLDDRVRLSHISGMYLRRISAVLILAIAITFIAAGPIIYLVTGNKYKSLGVWIVFGALYRSGIVLLSTCQLIAQVFNQPASLVRYFFFGGALSAACVGFAFWTNGIFGAITMSAISIILVSIKCISVLVSSGFVRFDGDDRLDKIKTDAAPIICLLIVFSILRFLNPPFFVVLSFGCICTLFIQRSIKIGKKFSSWLLEL